MNVPKIFVDDAMISPVVSRISYSMLNLVNPTHQLLVQYRASIDLTPSSILPPNIPSKGVEGSLKTSKGHKKKKHDEKPKEVVA